MSGSRNRDFGRRVKIRHEELGLSRRVVARHAGMLLGRLEAIEAEQLDHSDLVSNQLARLADVLKREVDWLVTGNETRVATAASVVAERIINRPIQGAFGFEDARALLNCPRCLRPGKGSRCGHCGNFLE